MGYFGVGATPPVEIGRRVHLAGVSDSNGFSLFIDGKVVSRSAPGRAHLISELQPIRGLPRAGLRFQGLIDELRISGKPRYSANFTSPSRHTSDPETLALYHFDEGQGSVARDSSRHGRHGVIVGAKRVMADGSPIPEAAATAADNFALEFNDGKDEVAIPGLTASMNGPFTWEGRVTPADGSDGTLAALPLDDGMGLYRVSFFKKGPEAIVVRAQKNGIGKTASATLPAAGTFHLAVVKNGANKWTLWINGEKVSEGEGHFGWNNYVRSSFPAKLGTEHGVPISESHRRGSFRGRLDEVRISSVDRYTQNFTPQERFETDKDTLALYHFDDNAGNTLMDSSGNSHHGTITGAKWVRVEVTPVAPPPTPVISPK